MACRQTPVRKYQSDVFLDAEITATYRNGIKRGDVRALSERFNRPRWWICNRAIELGLKEPATKDPDWSADEDELIAESAHTKPQNIVARLKRHGYARTESAVVRRLKRLGIQLRDARQVAGVYSGNQVAALLGMDIHALSRHVALKRLRAKASDGAGRFEISAANLRRFIRQYPEHVNLHRVDKEWFIYLLAGRHANEY